MLHNTGKSFINYDLIGPTDAPVVCMTHSLTSDFGMWAEQVPTILAEGFQVLRVDMRGHGGSTPTKGDYAMEELAADVVSLLDALGFEKGVHLIGLSMGGMIGQTLALGRPGLVASLALCDTSSRVPAEARPTWSDRIRTAETQGMEPLVEPTIGRWFTPGFVASRPDAVDPVRAMPPPETPERRLALRADLHDLGSTLAALGYRAIARRALEEARELYLKTEPGHPALKSIDAQLQRLEAPQKKK